ncbi:MAG: cyclic nucleotide-binding domain-containing protein [Acidimicrobiia bacterium]|nr:cyclic nucleotide-binding domain-containing protein [Acidimicrobiia bacterium]
MGSMSTRKEYVEKLQSIPLFASCTKKDLTMLARMTEPVSVTTGTELVVEGERGGDFYVVAGGRATVTRSGKEVATLRKGDHFGELSPLLDVPRNATITAASDLDLVVLRGRVFLDALSEIPGLSLGIIRSMAARLHDLDDVEI